MKTSWSLPSNGDADSHRARGQGSEPSGRPGGSGEGTHSGGFIWGCDSQGWVVPSSGLRATSPTPVSPRAQLGQVLGRRQHSGWWTPGARVQSPLSASRTKAPFGRRGSPNICFEGDTCPSPLETEWSTSRVYPDSLLHGLQLSVLHFVKLNLSERQWFIG